MTNNDVVDRNKILGSATQDFGFDKVLRGYDIKQVNEYISNLLATNKNAGELFDQRFEELKNSKSMLEYELSQSKGEVEKLTKLLEDIRAQRDTLQAQETSKGSNLDTSVVEEYQAKIDSLISKNRLLGEENKKLEDKNRDLIVNILKTKMELNLNIKNYEYAEQDQIDYFLYQIKANQARLDFLIKKAKESNIELSNIEKIKYKSQNIIEVTI